MANNTTLSQVVNAQGPGSTITDPFVTKFAIVDPTSNDVNYPIQKRWWNTANQTEWILISFSTIDSVTTANWQTISGQGAQLETLTGDTGGAVSPDASHNINLLGTAGQITVTGNPGTNTLTLALAGGGTAVDSFTTNVGGPVAPDSNGNINVNASVSTFTDGATANTLKTEIQGTNHALFVGRGTNVAGTTIPVGTTGQVLLGVTGSDPAFGNQPAFTSINIQTFTTSGTYTPHASMKFATIELVGGGGGAGGADTTGATTVSCGAGGAGGGYSRKTVSAATIGASQSVTVGTGGAGGIGNNPGSTGATTSVGAIISATGGGGGNAAAAGTETVTSGGLGGVGSSGDINIVGGDGGCGFGFYSAATSNVGLGGFGGSSYFGGGATAHTNSTSDGSNGSNYGGGASAAVSVAGGAAKTGGTGAPGVVIITEYI